MIIIPKKYIDNIIEPERALTLEEESLIIAKWGDDNNYWYFTIEDILTQEWIEYQNYINPSLTLIEVKKNKKDEIDKNTQDLIFKGFTYAELLWSMSITAQINWSNLPSIPESLYPINLLSQSDDIYILSFEKRMNFYLTAVGYKNGLLQSGSMLKMQVETKTNINEVINFIDNRI